MTDAVQALVKASTATPRAVGQVYNIGTGRSISVLELVAALNRLLGTNLTPQHGPTRAGDVRFSKADIRRTRRDLGYTPDVTFEEDCAERGAGSATPRRRPQSRFGTAEGRFSSRRILARLSDTWP